MSQTRLRIPSYRKHKASGKAVVTLDGRDFYLGPHGSQISRDEYDRLVSEWLANGRRSQGPGGSGGFDATVSILADRFLDHAETHYRRPDGSMTNSVNNFHQAIRPLRRLYGATSVTAFGPRQLKAVRQVMIDRGLCRTNINHQINRIRLIFRWGVENGFLPGDVLYALRAVASLQRHRSDAVESEPVRPVKEVEVGLVLPHVSRQVAAMIQLQLLTGARPGEIVLMRTIDIEMSGKVWYYRPERHKTEHHGHERLIPLGPKSQALIQSFLSRPLTAYLFSPAEAEAEWREQKRRDRKTKVQPFQQRRAEQSRKRQGQRQRAPGDQYDVGSYRRAIQRGCVKADIDSWHPHQLRHTAATNFRRDYGLDTARIILGQKSLAQTEVYAEADVQHASRVMLKSG